MSHPMEQDTMLMTPDEFLLYPLEEQWRAELVRGEVLLTPLAGGPHGRTTTNLVVLLSAYVEPRGLGWVFGDGVCYELLALPRTVRCPDGSYVRANRLPADGVEPGFLKLAPDLAIEVLSPRESKKKLEEKLDDYRASGTPLIWVVDLIRRTVMVITNSAPRRLLEATDTLDGGDVLPGFTCAVADVFRGVAPHARTRRRSGLR